MICAEELMIGDYLFVGKSCQRVSRVEYNEDTDIVEVFLSNGKRQEYPADARVDILGDPSSIEEDSESHFDRDDY